MTISECTVVVVSVPSTNVVNARYIADSSCILDTTEEASMKA